MRLLDGRVASVRSAVTIVVAVLLATMALAACTTRSSVTVAIVVSSSVNELAPTLAAGDRELLGRFSADPDVLSASAVVISAGRPAPEIVDLLPRRPNGEAEHGPRRGVLVDDRLDEVQRAVDRVVADATASDQLRGLDAASRSGADTILVLGAGLSTVDPLDLRVAGFDQDPEAVATALHHAGQLPDLTGRSVVFSGLGRTAGTQPPLGIAEQRYLRTLWIAICQRAGGRCTVEDGIRSATPTGSTVNAPVVEVPAASTTPGPAGQATVSVPAPLLFRPDSCTLIAPEAAASVLRPLAAQLRTGLAEVVISGRTAPAGSGDGVALSACRAQAAADVLYGLGVPAPAVRDVRGDGSLADPPTAAQDSTGHFDPTRFAALRRVVFTVTPKEGFR